MLQPAPSPVVELVNASLEVARGSLRDVHRAVERAKSDPSVSEGVLLSILAIYQAHLELAAGLVYCQRDRLPATHDCWRTVRRCASDPRIAAHAGHPEVRYALAALERAMASLSPLEEANAAAESFEGWIVDVDCARFKPSTGDWVSLERRHALRRIALTLVIARVESPGTEVSQAELIEQGWPGERALRAAVLNRLHFCLVTLRKLGWVTILQTRQQAYRLDPMVPLILRTAPPLDLSA